MYKTKEQERTIKANKKLGKWLLKTWGRTSVRGWGNRIQAGL
jgi:hypothetical protein